MSDDLLLAGVLRRFLEQREFFFIHSDSLTLDGEVEISEEEAAALLRVSDGWPESHRVVGQASDEFYK
jgi:hypothetical protein